MTRTDLLDKLDAHGRDFDRWDRTDHRTYKAAIGPFTITVRSHQGMGATWSVEHQDHGTLQEEVSAEVVSYARIEAIFYCSHWVREHFTHAQHA